MNGDLYDAIEAEARAAALAEVRAQVEAMPFDRVLGATVVSRPAVLALLAAPAPSEPGLDSAAKVRTALAHVQQALEWHCQGTRPTGISVELLEAKRQLSAVLALLAAPAPSEPTK